jgi:phosphatidylinositol glycan class H protein
MSSSKQYTLRIEPSIGDEDVVNSNLLKFTVVDSRVDFIIEYRIVFFVGILSILLGFLYKFFKLYQISHLQVDNIDRWDAGIVVVLVVALLAVCLRQQPHDSVCVMKDIGIQLVSRKSWRLQNSFNTFVPLNNIIDLVIHEGLHDYGQVIFYLCILTKADKSKQQNSIQVIFPEFLPRKDILMKVRKLSRDLLFGESRRYFRRVPGQGLRQIHHH